MKLFKDIEKINQTHLLTWQNDALRAFSTKMKDREYLFPWVPATQSFSLGHLRYGFVGHPESNQTSIELAGLLKEFTINCKDYEKYTTLIIFFETPRSMNGNTVFMENNILCIVLPQNMKKEKVDISLI